MAIGSREGPPASRRAAVAWLATLGVLALVGNGALVVLNLGRVAEAQRWVAHSDQVLDALGALLRSVQDAEAGQRGYLLTGDPAYLAPWEDASASLQAQLARLEALTGGDPDERAGLASLRPLVERKVAELAATIELRRGAGGAQRARTLVRSDLGRRLMETIRARIGEASRAEDARMAARSDAARDALRRTGAAHLLGLLASLGLIGAALALAAARERERRRAEAYLRQFELLAHHSRDVVLFMRRDGRILDANAAAVAAYGYGVDELRQLTVEDLRAEETRVLVAGQMAEADGAGLLFESVHRRRDGSTFPVEVSSQGATIGGARTLVSVIRDITERTRAAEALRASEARLRRLLEALPQLVWSADAAGRLEYFNQRWRDYTGQAAGAEAWDPALHPEDRDRVVAAWQEAVAHRGEIALEHRLRRFDGEYRWFLRRAILLPGQEGTGGRWFGTCTDIHDLKVSQEVLRQADRLKDDFLSMASHELRTPLTALRLQADLLGRALRRGGLADDRSERPLAVMRAQIERLQALVGVLLDVSRLNAGRFTLERDRLDLAEVAREVVERLRPEAEGAGTELRLRGPGVTGRWDRIRLEQVITNLVSNAIKYGGRRPVEVEVGARDGHALLVVRDHGIGIAPESRLRLFQRFERASNATAFPGLGLGLWIARRIAEAHGGDISVDSEIGAGSTFTLRIPRDPEDAGADPAAPRGGRAGPPEERPVPA